MKWLEIQVTTSQEAEEAVTGILYDLGAGGVVIKNPNDVKELAQTSEWDYFDPSLLEEGEEVKISAYFLITTDITDKVNFLKERIWELKSFGINVGNVKVEVSEVDEEDWADSWKKYYKPLKVGKRIVVRPLWEEYSPKEGEIVIDLDPGMAFGTGTHETTKMCLQFLEDIVKPGAIVFDVGCGSGILSIAASKLGASYVYGADVDEMAVKIARENVKLNGLENVEIFQSDLLKNFRGKADVIVANIIADAIIRLIPDVLPHLKEEGLFLASGIIKDRFEEVKERAEEFFEIIDMKEEKEWLSILMKKKG
ncbi:ribosomal protein L11 methyltransferase [Caldanaerobacter subterraneus subsp. tengcongensis MB4]|uniref:Ribosomal protein L11 methyltransferase n=1 Tax=Caldanaerobacter subterraneus subsp. tengcongensis (strain DSM 15242 / JCM 11007 / NBRC 100824 / MB4) TaxID=273068 RepID=PRMA_CALS4|nr:50S ribosomal protein L11 methyltransferase [Caldanaerobacter subterraneus]Q8RB66.1 RecName: Full=Ribosomal protein L11 methyltransferase; Short=L11 Mtase [Caldanaerobacter subterraneus subsp. tengcongensis MB4]AAM24213.1 Ribosomal protein L11 methylase [Caldanaerobacter subterraneus subsp. tengcongensis MB4]MCS3916259.1 ribosomal protein L11 methyltransferase [Caldanaerobacter subterraneus subsp. tengcongensis MB4]